MRQLLPLAVLACALVAAPVCGTGAWAAEGGDPAAATPTPLKTTMAKKGTVRFGPNLKAKAACILDAGSEVELLGPAEGMPGWYVVRFPREGSAWMHQKVLQAQPDGKTFLVLEDRARARDDATQGASIVAELAKGDLVEGKGRVVGAWVAVYPSNAVAYVHKSVINLPKEVVQAAVAKGVVMTLVDAQWQVAEQLDAQYEGALRRNLDLAATLDWSLLARLLDAVGDGHPSVAVQLKAKAIRERLAKVIHAVATVQEVNHLTPVRDVPGEPRVATPEELVDAAAARAKAQGGDEHAVAHQPKPAPEQPKPATEPEQPKPTPEQPTPEQPKPVVVETPKPEQPVAHVASDDLKTAAATAPTAPGAFAATGWLEERAYPQVGANHVIIDKDGLVCAFVTVKAGTPIQLSEFFWRNVGVRGEVKPVEQSLHNLGKAVPLVVVDDIALLGK